MVNNVLNSLQLFRTKHFSGLVDENMISNALQTRPHEISTVLSYIFGTYENTSLDFLTSGLGRTMTIDQRHYEWDVMIDSEKPITIRKAVWADTTVSSSSHKAGLGNTTFELWLSDKWFGPGAILAFDDRTYKVRVQGAPRQDGNSWVYTVAMANGSATSYVPYNYLLEGKEVHREGSAYEEYSDEADIVNYQTPFKLRNHLTTHRLSYDITGSASVMKMVIAMKMPDGKMTYLWSDMQEWIALRQWYQSLERSLIYSNYNANSNGTVDLIGSNGRPVYIGAGMLEQISPANKRNYTTMTAELLENYLYDLSFNMRTMGDRKFVAFAGEMAMREFDRVLKDKAGNYTTVDTKFISGSGQELTLGGQFTTYKMINGVELTLKHVPVYDNTIINRTYHPVTGKPLESYRMTFLDLGTSDGESKLHKVVRTDREMVMWHTGGSVAPGSGHSKSINTLRSNARDGYQVHFLGEQGIRLADPTTCGELICTAS